MIVTKPVPTLSPQGWVNDPSSKADALLAYFYEAMKSQTAIYGDNVTSLQHLIQLYGGDINVLSQKIQNALEKYFGRYYDIAIATVSNSISKNPNSPEVEITIHCELGENGVTYSLGSLLKINNSKITSVTKINNG